MQNSRAQNGVWLMTDRTYLRTLRPSDADGPYIDWMRSSENHFISDTNQNYSIEDLKQYISKKTNSLYCLFFGIFTLNDNIHIGNIKFEPISYNERTTTVGILIGNRDWRGIGVASEVLMSCCTKLSEECGLETVCLYVNRGNSAAIKAYRKVGFEASESPSSVSNSTLMMLWRQ